MGNAQGGRLGAGIQGATPVIPFSGGGKSWPDFTKNTQGYMWGTNASRPNETGLGLSSAIDLKDGADILACWPQIFPEAGIIRMLQWWITATFNAGQKISFAIYDSNDQLVPGNRVYQSGDITACNDTPGSTGANAQTLQPNLTVAKNSLLWLAWNYNQLFSPNPPDATTLRILMMDDKSAYPILGYPANYAAAPAVGGFPNPSLAEMASNNRYAYGWYVARAQSAGMPTVFPAATILGGSSIPADIAHGGYLPAVNCFLERT